MQFFALKATRIGYIHVILLRRKVASAVPRFLLLPLILTAVIVPLIEFIVGASHAARAAAP